MVMPSIFNDNLFDDFFRFPFYNDKDEHRMEKKLYGHRAHNLMKTDIRERKGSYVLDIDLPGFKKDELTIELNDGYLTISASTDTNNDEKDKDGHYIRRERYSGSCQRSFYVGKDVTENDIKASFEDGTLKMTIPKKEAKPAVESKKQIAIEG